MKVPAAICLLVLLVGACAGPAPSAPSSSLPPSSVSALPTIDPGIGWRLVASVDRGSKWAYTVRAATTQAEWSRLWQELSPGLAEPVIDFANEIAIVFGEGTGGPGNCSERRLDGVVIDQPTGIVYSRISDPLAPRICDSVLGGAAIFVVALARASLPPVPFTAQLHETLTCDSCAGSERITVDSL